MAVPGPGRDAEEGGPTVMSCSSCPGAAGVLSKTVSPEGGKIQYWKWSAMSSARSPLRAWGCTGSCCPKRAPLLPALLTACSRYFSVHVQLGIVQSGFICWALPLLWRQ